MNRNTFISVKTETSIKLSVRYLTTNGNEVLIKHLMKCGITRENKVVKFCT